MCRQVFFRFGVQDGCNGGRFINVWASEVFWVFFFGNIIKETALKGLLNVVARNVFCNQDYSSCLWVTGGAYASFFL